MKKIFCSLACCFLLLTFSASSVTALQFTLSSYDIFANTSDPHLKIQTENILTEPYSFDLDPGVPETISLFKIWTSESAVNADDKQSQPISIDMEYTTGSQNAQGSIAGSTQGNTFMAGLFQWGSVAWDEPQTFDLDGYQLMASLSGEIFNPGIGGLWGKKGQASPVSMTLSSQETAAPVPEPGTMLLFGAGLLGLAAFGHRSLKSRSS